MPYVDAAVFGEHLGSTLPRLWTRPLVTGPAGPCGCGCALTPATSDGFDLVDYASDVLGTPLYPWQRWLVIHALELLPDGRPRFRRVVMLVARQNGKTFLSSVLAAFWLDILEPCFVLGTSTKTSVAKEPWAATINLIRGAEDLKALITRGGIRRAAGEEELTLTNGSRYKVSAANEDGGRGLPLDRVLSDEARSHHDYSAYGAAYYAMRARPYAQYWLLSSMGDDRSAVLNDLRDLATEYIEVGEGDARLGLFEWSAPQHASPVDVEALLMANPNAGRTFDVADLVNEGAAALRKGGEALTDFRTEGMNIRVGALDPALDAEGWKAGLIPGDLEQLRRGLVWCVDVTPDGLHATLVAGALMPDDRVRVEVVKRWEGPLAVTVMTRELPGMVARNKPRMFGWFPNGGAAAAADMLADRKGRYAWPPRGVVVEAVKGEVAAACMTLAAAVRGVQIVHSGDPLLDRQVESAGKLMRPNDTWRFAAQGETYVDACYALAGVNLMARTLPTPKGRPRVIVPRAAREP